MSRLLRYLKPHLFAILFIVFLNITGTVFSVIIPKITGQATTEIFNGVSAKITGTGGMDYDRIAGFIMRLLALYITSNAFYFAQGFIMNHISQRIAYGLRKSMVEKISRLPLPYFDTQTRGDIISRVTNDVENVSTFIRSNISQIATSLTTVVFGAYMMLTINPIMTLLVIFLAPVSVVVSAAVAKRSQRFFKAYQEDLGRVTGLAEETYSGHSVMTAFNAQSRASAAFGKANGRLYESAWKSQAFSGIIMPFVSFIGNLGYIGVCLLGSLLTAKRMLEVGDILAFIQYVRSFTNPIAQIASTTGSVQSMIAAANRVFAFLGEPEEEKDTDSPVKTPDAICDVAFDRIRFGYNPAKPVICDFSANISPGQRIAIVGPTGAGKTTIVKLLMRFYDTDCGSITINGINIRDFKRSDLRGMVGMVLQDAWLHSGTIMENIRYGRLSASDCEVVDASRLAFADHFISALPNGYSMVLNEGADNISQGERQLLTIARAILADPMILILDEATSSVDTRTEALIQQAMGNLMRDRTCFIIAHRLSTIRDADLILVMKGGNIVEQGTHEELLARKGVYCELYESL